MRMLKELSVRNLALADSVKLSFGSGFSVFTGETGAGKSMIIGAVGLLLGERASSESVRAGADEAEITGVFEFAKLPAAVATQLAGSGIDAPDGSLIIRRLISIAGKNRVFINQVPVPLATLKGLGDRLIDLHGQHDHQSLLRDDAAVAIVDRLAGVAAVRSAYNASFDAYAQARHALTEHDRVAKLLAEKRDLIEFSFNEIDGLSLVDNEETALEDEFKLLSSITERIGAASEIESILSGDDNRESVIREITHVRKVLDSLVKFDATIGSWHNDLESALSTLTELSRFIAEYREKAGDSADPGRLETINSRLAKIQRLKKKYGVDFAGLLAKCAELRDQLSNAVNADADRAEILKQLDKAESACRASGKKLTDSRMKACESFDKAISKEMLRLGISGGEWKTVFDTTNALTPSGLETMNFHVRTNPGEPLLPLVKCASGGEISRMMLAIKTILAEQDSVPILVFDEVDTGIGGTTASEVAKSLYALGKTHQVLCISHLHQIAAVADRQYSVYKSVEGGRTVTHVTLLDNEERVGEIARMLGGESKGTREHAKEILGR